MAAIRPHRRMNARREMLNASAEPLDSESGRGVFGFMGVHSTERIFRISQARCRHTSKNRGIDVQIQPLQEIRLIGRPVGKGGHMGPGDSFTAPRTTAAASRQKHSGSANPAASSSRSS